MDINYWEEYYASCKAEENPTLFAQFCAEKIGGQKRSIIELGCGTARDAVFFASLNHHILAIDQCIKAIETLKQRHQSQTNLRFYAGDFTNLTLTEKFDVVYSRFTLHSISEKEEIRVLNWAYNQLNAGGKFCIEFRGQKNEIYKLGTPVKESTDAFVYDNHYRRFVEINALCARLKEKGFNVEYAEEAKDFAPYQGKNETYARIIAQK
ncbi:MAG: class I SAM-dependent methyltransferase [Bacteroidales bacterium]